MTVELHAFGSPREREVNLKDFEDEFAAKPLKKSKRKAENRSEDAFTVDQLIRIVGKTNRQDFSDKFKEVMKRMIGPNLTRDDRLSSLHVIRTLAASAAFFNRKSKSHSRDYNPIAFAVVLESIFVEAYRPDFLDDCSVSYQLRIALADYFNTIMKTIFVNTKNGGTVASVPKWSFVDGIPESYDGRSLADFKDTERLQDKIVDAALVQIIRKNNSIRQPIQKLLASELILSVDSPRVNGTRPVESVIYLLLNWTVRVSDPCVEISLRFVGTQLTCSYPP
jgi:hypothetical protein